MNFIFLVLTLNSSLLFAQNIEKYLFEKNWKVIDITCSETFIQPFSKRGNAIFNGLDNILSNRIGLSFILTFENGFIETEDVGAYFQRDPLTIDNRYLKVEYRDKINILEIKKLTNKRLVLIDENMSQIKLVKIDRSKINIKKVDMD